MGFESYRRKTADQAQDGQLTGGQSRLNMLSRLVMIILILGTLALYVRTLGRQSLWSDEALSVAFAGRPLLQLLRTMVFEDLHPPLYYVILHFWMILAGTSEFAVRMPSAFAAVLLVPLACAIAREVFGKRGLIPGIAAGALTAASPLIAYNAQETRMYSLAAALALAAVWAYLIATRTSARRWWVAFACMLAAGLYTLYFLAFIIPAFWCYALLFDRRSWQRTVLSTLAAVVLYLPWVIPVYLQLARLQRSPDYWVTTRIDPISFAAAILERLLPSSAVRWALLPVALGTLLFAGFALAKGIRLSERGRRLILVFLVFLIPFGLTYLMVALVPKFAPRYAIVTAAPLCICICLGLYMLLGAKLVTRVLFGLLIGAAVLISLPSTVAVVEGRVDARDDTRALGAYLTENVQPSDTLILAENAPYALQYYFRGAMPWYGYHVGQDFEGAANMLTTVLRNRTGRVWLVHWRQEFADPTDMILTELMRVGRMAVKQEFPGYRLYGFDIRDHEYTVVAYPEPTKRIRSDFAPGIRLLGFDRLDNDPGQVHYVLYWQALKQLTRNYSLTFTFEDLSGNEYLRRDQALCTDYFLPPQWPLQIPIRGRVDVILPGDLPPVLYRIYVKVWDPQSQRNLDLVDEYGDPLGEVLLLEELALSKGALAATPFSVKNSLRLEVGDHLQLLGYDLSSATHSPGDTLQVTLWWQSTDRPDRDHQARFSLLDSGKTEVWGAAQPVVSGHPTTQWQEGEINRAVYDLPIPASMPGGEYRLQVGTEDRQVAVTSIEIVAREHRYDLPLMQESVGAQFESGVVLLGYDLQAPAIQPGQTITVTLYWQTRQLISTSYKVSVQILETGPRIITQDDSIPAHWTRPTTAWLVGEIITDEHVLSIPSGAAPGTWTLTAALYDETTLQRLRVEQGGTRDQVTLAMLHSEP